MRHHTPILTPDEIAAEEWRTASDRREVSSLGRIRATKTRRLITPFTVNGYQKVWLGARQEYVHRAVLIAFAGPCPDGFEVAHGGTGNRSDNRLANLRWASRRDNSLDRYEQGTVSTALAPHLADIGRIPDAEIARRCGVGRSAVHNYRKRRGIERAPTPTPAGT